VRKNFLIINALFEESEKKGLGKLRTHSSNVKGEQIRLNIENDVSTGVDVARKVELSIYTSKTIAELKKELGKQIKYDWDQIKLQKKGMSKTEIQDKHNGCTIGEMQLKNGDTLQVFVFLLIIKMAKATKRPVDIPQALLITPEKQFTPTAKKVFQDWFAEFSTNGKMNADQCGDFINSCLGKNLRKQELSSQF